MADKLSTEVLCMIVDAVSDINMYYDNTDRIIAGRGHIGCFKSLTSL